MAVKRDIAPTPVPYQGIGIVSPMMFGEEQKDQDRARFFGPGLVGCVCDGVSTSPRSADAADLVTSYAPILFEGDIDERLSTISDLLMAYRKEFQTMHLAVPADMPAGMQTMLREVLRQKQASSYQTTMIAVRVRADGTKVLVDVLRCGDSAFFAFSADGELLSSSLASSSESADRHHRPLVAKGLRFGPGDQILVRAEGPLDIHANLAMKSGLQEKHFRNWIVCTPVETRSETRADVPERREIVIRPDDRLLVPRYLYGQQLESNGQEYRCLDYSSTIRIVARSLPSVSADGIEHRGSATTVLPDHFYSGHFDSLEDQFPPGTHFVLCSDGFYSVFARASELWAWLQENRDVFGNTQEQEPRLRELHRTLHEKSGDDDMSFVWMYPMPSAAPKAGDAKSEQEE